MAAAKIISIGPLLDSVCKEFEPEFEVICIGDSSRPEVESVLDESVHAVIARGPVFVDGALMDMAPNLRLIARTGVGYDSIDISAATARMLPVVYTPGAMTIPVAEHAMSLILAASKRLNEWRTYVQGNDWEARYQIRSFDLDGRTLGIIGYGRIGSQVRRLIRPFNVDVIADDPYIDHSRYAEDEVTFMTLEETLRRADIITLHVPLTEETRGLINSNNIDTCKEGAILINTARGSVIESLDLLNTALTENRLSAVGLDVFPDEPPEPSHPLFQNPRALFTGHVAARSPLSQQRILDTMVREVRAILDAKRPNPQNIVNPEVLD